ncbi:hypothetical protein ACERII_14935 [Evansella sp. AB-rgal1]|uniref:hypothetical protein n=1 Tax=Evansella sp. AB-rgal1 TaxID=3242696 RepID=UPI00359D3082
MIHPIFELTEWLERQKEHTLLISKQEFVTGKNEIMDHDQVRLQLKDVSVRSIEHHDEDDYLADQEIILHGQGMVRTDIGESELPQGVYEIPLFGEVKTINEAEAMKVETEKAIYTIQVH